VTTTISLPVPDISCGHCVATISGAVSPLQGVAAVDVDLVTKTVNVTGTADTAAISHAIEQAGYRVAC
jgi:copper chaperone